MEFTIEGMHCAGCSGAVEKAIARTQGVREVAVNLMMGLASVQTDLPEEQHADLAAAVEKAVEDAGYKATLKKKRD